MSRFSFDRYNGLVTRQQPAVREGIRQKQTLALMMGKPVDPVPDLADEPMMYVGIDRAADPVAPSDTMEDIVARCLMPAPPGRSIGDYIRRNPAEAARGILAAMPPFMAADLTAERTVTLQNRKPALPQLTVGKRVRCLDVESPAFGLDGDVTSIGDTYFRIVVDSKEADMTFTRTLPLCDWLRTIFPADPEEFPCRKGMRVRYYTGFDRKTEDGVIGFTSDEKLSFNTALLDSGRRIDFGASHWLSCVWPLNARGDS